MKQEIRGELLAEGKTKRVYATLHDSLAVILESKDDITKHDNPDETEILPGKGALCNYTTVRVFELLEENKVATAYLEWDSDNSFVAYKVAMLPLEIVVRNKGYGSWLERNPHIHPKLGQKAVEFKEAVFELFLKTTSGRLEHGGAVIIEGLNQQANDPWIPHPYAAEWAIRYSKLPLTDPAGDLPFVIDPQSILGKISIQAITALAFRVNEVLTRAWKNLGYDLIDFKMEVGMTANGELVVADVLDADSWRLWNAEGEAFDKQLFRDGKSLTLILERYQIVADLASRFFCG